MSKFSVNESLNNLGILTEGEQMLIVYLMKGLPASGKSSKAREMLADNPNGIKRVNKDDLRAMLDDSKHSKDAEKFVLKIRDSIILHALEHGKHLIVDDTNLDPKHEKMIRDLVTLFNSSHDQKAKVDIIDFTHITPEECIERDNKRTGFEKVGEKVIREMYNRYLNKSKDESVRIKYDPTLPNTILVDVDGTLALNITRSPYDNSKYHEDALNEPVARMVKAWKASEHCHLIVVSGREDKFKDITSDWLKKNDIFYDDIFMRPSGDFRKDDIIKEEIFRKHIEGKFNVIACIDDRNRVVTKWRELGLTCFQVAEGAF